MRNYLNFEDEIKNLESEIDKLKDPYNNEGLSEVDTNKISKIQSEIDRFNVELLETRRRLRDVQYQLTEDIERLGANLKAIDTALVPILLTIVLLMMHYMRIQRRKTLKRVKSIA